MNTTATVPRLSLKDLVENTRVFSLDGSLYFQVDGKETKRKPTTLKKCGSSSVLFKGEHYHLEGVNVLDINVEAA